MIQRVNYRRASYKDTPNVFFLLYIIFCALLFIYIYPCALFCFSVLPLSLGTKIKHEVVIVEIFLDRSATLYLLVPAISACFHLGRT